ncbi:transposase [Burkholderia ambifaria]|uniref:transposase n=1 Tax=Burkholderia ambifaria TaxID=152480 RepID=UPI003C7AE63A
MHEGQIDGPILAMNERALHQGHHYATVVVDPPTRQRSCEMAGPFKQCPKDAAKRIEAATIDMNTAYELEIRKQWSQAEIAFELHHFAVKHGREAIDRVWVDPPRPTSKNQILYIVQASGAASKTKVKSPVYVPGFCVPSNILPLPPL